MLEFAVPELVLVSSEENINFAAENVESQTLRKQLGSDSKEHSASRVVPSKSVKRNNRSSEDTFTNVSSWKTLPKCFLETIFLLQFFSTLVVKSQLLMMFFNLMNIK